MAKLPKEEVEKIIEKSMKGYKVREEKPTDNPTNRVKPDAGGLDLDALRKKFLANGLCGRGATNRRCYGG